MHNITILKQTRTLIHQALQGLSNEQYFTIPKGFDNNIAWNLGHIVVVQQLLHYKLSGAEMYIPMAQVGLFRTGTSPADWQTQPEIPPLIDQLLNLPSKLEEDYSAGKLTNYQTYTTSTNITLTSIEEALTFNNFHEGFHLGFILALRNFVG